MFYRQTRAVCRSLLVLGRHIGDINAWDEQPWVTMVMGNAVMAIVFWTGIIKWQLPRIKKWNRNRKKAAASNA